ncbi:NADH-dependent dehydrogenase [Luteitalea sp. TBR-22]|uniref:Gfo/Idh/MocA family protein n=1 Tax=Luteitalea sp. TBR-22 TaxID=2802971 RepID=UPI001AFC7BBF|nr:Gfo/Idh/MocA family oxidoreductase [Luteitalea sp. TBR-22]BCS32064.1 NADH-dependent dehydrogenase [Luteitalea sp. TBR-22]
MRRPLRGVGIGAGYFAPFQYEAWSRIPEVEIVALADLGEERALPILQRYGVSRYYADWREMIDREAPDFVDIITPPDTHEEMCRYAADRGVHIICQKPLAPTLETSRRIVEHARAAGVRFMVHENFRWQPWYRAIKQVREAGTIGEFTHVAFMMRMGDGWGPDAYLSRQPFFRDYPRLLVHETGVHFIDTFRFLLGDIDSVFAQLRRLNPVIAGEDAGQVVLTFANRATAIWDANRYNEGEAEFPRYTFGTLRIDGTRGHLTMDADATIRLKPLGEPARELDYARANVNFAGDCVYFLQRHFVECMLSGAEFESSGVDYLKTIEAVEGAYASAASGQVVRLGEALQA